MALRDLQFHWDGSVSSGLRTKVFQGMASQLCGFGVRAQGNGLRVLQWVKGPV